MNGGAAKLGHMDFPIIFKCPRTDMTVQHLLADEAAFADEYKAVVREAPMQKFVLKLLLTSLVFRRGSKRIEGAQLVASLLTLVVIISVGLYVWAHGLY